MAVSARSIVWICAGAILLIAAALLFTRFRRDLGESRTLLKAIPTQTARTSFGNVEYLVEGDGPVVLLSHGITGGVDQARGIAASYLGDGYRFLLPSRFGYLGSSMPADPSAKKQAAAFVQLMDACGIERAFLAGYSAGGTAALHFAIDYPDRCSGLILLSSNVPQSAPLPPRPAMAAVFGSNFLYWGAVRAFSKGMMGMFIPPEVWNRLTASRQEALVGRIMLACLPIRRRTAGILFDMYVSNPSINGGLDYNRIRAPSLLIHAIDDPAPPIEGARFIARSIPQAEIMEIAQGGHLLLDHEREIQQQIRRFIAASLR